MPPEVKRAVFGDQLRSTALDNRDPRGKPELVGWYSKLVASYDSLGLCMFPVSQLGAWGPTHMADLCSSYLGIDYSPEDVVLVGERVATLKQSFVMRYGWHSGHEAWPDRFHDEPLPDGPRAGQTLSRKVMQELRSAYYMLMGWDPETGTPLAKTLERLGVTETVDAGKRYPRGHT